MASNSELRSMLYLAVRLKYVDENMSKEIIAKTNEVSKMLYAFIKFMK
ncbi:four helix bundle protein [Maribacter sp. CXY002]